MPWKTITTFLVDGNPTWIKTIELSNWVGKAIQIPRAKLKDAKDRKEITQPAIYFLFWEDEEGNNRAYIWEAENLINRLSNHDTNKDFWSVVIAFISKDNNLTKADVKYLEAKSLERAKKSGRYFLENSIEPVINTLPEHQIATMEEFLENIDLLISAIGFPILKNFETKALEKSETIYYLNARWSDARGIYTEDGFIVLNQSKFSKDYTTSFDWTWVHQQRWRIQRDWDLFDTQNCILKQDILFTSSSTAASIVAWNALNWWIVWKTKDWKTLDEIERRNLK